MILIIAIGIGTLFAIALYQMLQRNVIRSAIGVILLGSAINLFLLTAGNSNGTGPAYSTVTETQVDPLPQALVLTAIVISMGGLAFISPCSTSFRHATKQAISMGSITWKH